MKVKKTRYLKYAVVATTVIGVGLFLISSQKVRDARGDALIKSKATGAATRNAANKIEETGEARTEPADQPHPVSPPSTSSGPLKQPDVFGLSGAVQLEDIPEGRFRDELARLTEPARRYALDKLGKLHVPLNDVASLSVEENGQLFYQCSLPSLPPPTELTAVGQDAAQADLPGSLEKTEAAAAVPISSPPVRHSRPGATKVIYLDFNGHTISGTAWNSKRGNEGDANYRPAVASYLAKTFDADGDASSFSDSEQATIIRVWERIAEDFSSFDVDVTTEEPVSFNRNTGRILITDNVDANGVNMPSSGSAGVAYLDVFGDFNYASFYSPALVYANQLSKSAAFMAEAASHEMGHNLSLSHDGTSGGSEYYGGHGSGENSWNTIMGSSSSRNVTQWSKGEYYNANNNQDDLAEIAARLGYVPDDYTDSNATAAPLAVSGLTLSGAGIISQTGEADRFAFASGAGAITINVATFRSASQSHGGNLDLALELYDSGGTLVASANVDGAKNASLNTTVSGGTYYLRVFGAGSGTPSSSGPTGYTNYGSLGQYTISGTVISTGPVAPSFTVHPASRSVATGGSVAFSATAGGSPSPTFQWKKGGVNLAGATNSSFTIASVVAGNAGSYTVVATNASGSATSNAATLTVLVVAPSGAIISIVVE